MIHTTVVVGKRQDGSLVWKCTKCKRVGLGLLGPCKAWGPRGRKAK